MAVASQTRVMARSQHFVVIQKLTEFETASVRSCMARIHREKKRNRVPLGVLMDHRYLRKGPYRPPFSASFLVHCVCLPWQLSRSFLVVLWCAVHSYSVSMCLPLACLIITWSSCGSCAIFLGRPSAIFCCFPSPSCLLAMTTYHFILSMFLP